jgi:hypothetical protein
MLGDLLCAIPRMTLGAVALSNVSKISPRDRELPHSARGGRTIHASVRPRFDGVERIPTFRLSAQ